MTQYDPKKTYIFSLKNIMANNKNTIEKFCESIKRRGYAFVRMTPYMESQISACTNTINNFFMKDIKHKSMFKKAPIFGYFNAKHKESFRLLTGRRLDEHIYPYNFEKIEALARFSDEIMYRLCILCSPYLFPDIKHKALVHNISLFDPLEKWGMLDMTIYKNDGSKKGLNCDEHYDPGLLSIHYRSTQPGLQLKNENNKWINPPSDKNIVIIWAGDVATKINPKIKRGVHRVLNTNSRLPRIALWYEICTKEQEHTELMNVATKKLAVKEHQTGIPISKSR
jgi:isopenicillin N synthase-like dioxygenase